MNTSVSHLSHPLILFGLLGTLLGTVWLGLPSIVELTRLFLCIVTVGLAVVFGRCFDQLSLNTAVLDPFLRYVAPLILTPNLRANLPSQLLVPVFDELVHELNFHNFSSSLTSAPHEQEQESEPLSIQPSSDCVLTTVASRVTRKTFYWQVNNLSQLTGHITSRFEAESGIIVHAELQAMPADNDTITTSTTSKLYKLQLTIPHAKVASAKQYKTLNIHVAVRHEPLPPFCVSNNQTVPLLATDSSVWIKPWTSRFRIPATPTIDRVYIRMELGFAMSSTDTRTNQQWSMCDAAQKSTAAATHDLLELYNHGQLQASKRYASHDLAFQFNDGNQLLYAHRTIVCTRSSVLNDLVALFDEEKKVSLLDEGCLLVELNEDPRAFGLYLRWLYGGIVPAEANAVPAEADEDLREKRENALQLYQLALKYNSLELAQVLAAAALTSLDPGLVVRMASDKNCPAAQMRDVYNLSLTEPIRASLEGVVPAPPGDQNAEVPAGVVVGAHPAAMFREFRRAIAMLNNMHEGDAADEPRGRFVVGRLNVEGGRVNVENIEEEFGERNVDDEE